ncbi:MAG: M48 family metallopeptidase [Candidatus Aminicenantes bacterium]|nr:M48 family metallopeptidase [Candidatus Aminicenantes bacterium]
MRRQRKKPASQILRVSGIDLPINIYLENRNNSRISLGKTAVHIRLPFWLSKREKELQTSQFLKWVRRKIIEKAVQVNKEKPRRYKNGDKLQVGSDQYQINIDYKDRKTGSARINGQQIQIVMPESLKHEGRSDMIAALISRCLAAQYLPWISQKINKLNQLYFKQHINRITLKNTKTRWGSCSQKGNINLSTRILFAPEEVIDYVCVHELAHLRVPDHSKKFWSLLESVAPDYKQHIQWLKKNGPNCRF